MAALQRFLLDHVAGDGEAPSHTSMVGGCWFIPKDEDSEFFELYITALNEGHHQFFSERILPGCKFTFFVDLDFPNAAVLERIVEHNDIPDVLQFYQRLVAIFEDTLDTLTDNNIRVVFSKKPSAVYKMHINYPTVICDDRHWAMNAISKIRESFVAGFRIRECPILAAVNWNKVFDALPYSGGLRMPGSRKDRNDGPGDEYQIIDLETGEVLPLTVGRLHETSIRLESHTAGPDPNIQYDGIADEIPVGTLKEYVSHLRRERSFGDMSLSYRRSIRVLNAFIVELNDRQCPFKKSEHRRSSKYLYLKITTSGCQIRCHDETCAAKKMPAIALTPEMSAVFDGVEAISLDVTNPERYYLADLNIQLRLTREISETMKGLHNDDATLATVFLMVFRGRFCVAKSGKDAIWYAFKEHVFEMANDLAHVALPFVIGPLYKLFVHGMYPDVFCREGAIAPGGAAEDGEDDEDDEDDEGRTKDRKRAKTQTVKAVHMILAKLAGKRSGEAILAQAARLFVTQKGDATDRLDAERNLMAFQNGVLDFSIRDSPVFRDGRYADFLTIQTSTTFRFLNHNDEKLEEVHAFFASLFPSAPIRDYILRVLSKCLTASETERLYILTGSGSNGKSKLVRLIQKTFGEYWRDISVSVLTQKRKASNAASPELVDMKGRHIITTQEPEADMKLNVGYVLYKQRGF